MMIPLAVLRQYADAGATLRDAAEALGVTRGAVCGLASRNKIKFKGHTRGEKNSHARLTAKQVLEIRRRYQTELGKNLAPEFGITLGTLYQIVEGYRWKHLLPSADPQPETMEAV